MGINPNSCDEFSAPPGQEAWGGTKCANCKVNLRNHKPNAKKEETKEEKKDEEAIVYKVEPSDCPGFLASVGVPWSGMPCADCGTKRSKHQGDERIVVNLVKSWKLDPSAPDFKVGQEINPDFSKLQYYAHLPGAGPGSAGVIAVQVEKDGIYIVKGAERCEREAFAAALAGRFGAMLSKGAGDSSEAPASLWQSPPTTAIHCSGAAFKALIKGLTGLSKQRAEYGEDDSIIGRLSNCKFIMVMQLAKGQSLEQLGSNREPDADRLLTRRVLASIGGMLLLDVLINNWDRLPIAGVWSNQGNAGNLLLHSPSHQRGGQPDVDVSLIDQTVTVIGADQLEEYISSVKVFVSKTLTEHGELGKDADKGAKSVSSVRDALLLHARADVGNPGERAILQGFVAGLSSLGFMTDGASTVVGRLERELGAVQEQVLAQMCASIEQGAELDRERGALRDSLEDSCTFISKIVTAIAEACEK